jgi:hypothetical protein
VTPAHHDIIPLLDLLHEQGNVGGIILQIGVHGDQDLARCMVDACYHGRSLAMIAPELDHTDARINVRQGFTAHESIVRTAIVDEEDLEAPSHGLDGRNDGLVKRLYVVLFVVGGHNDRECRRTRSPLRNRTHGDFRRVLRRSRSAAQSGRRLVSGCACMASYLRDSCPQP